VAHIADMADRWRDEGPYHPGFDVAYSTAASCVMQGGIADNVVPEECRVHYEFRNLPGTDEDAMQREVLARAAQLEGPMRKVDAASGFSFEAFASMPAFQAPEGDPAVALAQRLAGTAQTALVAFGTEAGLFQRAGIPTVICGPGSIAQAHQADEYVSLEQLAACERFLRGLMAA